MPSRDGHPLALPTMLVASKQAVDNDLDYYEDAGDDDNELMMVQKVLQQSMEKKRMAAAKQQIQVLEEYKAGAEKRIAALEAAITKVWHSLCVALCL